MTFRGKKIAHVLWALAAAACLGPAESVQAVFWNNDPNFGTTGGTSGLTDQPLWFPNDYIITNTSNSTRGTTILLNNEWALSVRHVVQNGSDYSTITSPGNMFVNVGGADAYGGNIYTPDGGSEISLTHLRGGVPGALNLLNNIDSATNEAGKIVEIGGYGYWGVIDTTAAAGSSDVVGTESTAATFHRAYNIASIAGNGQINIGTTGTGNATLIADHLVQGSAESGDSGGPMFAFYGTNFATQASDMTQWKLVGLTATASALNSSGGTNWGTNSNYTRVSSFANWISTTIANNPWPTSTTGAWAQDSGNNLYDDGSNVISVTNPTAAPVVHATFGSGTNHTGGYTLSQANDKIVMTATLSAPLVMNNIQFRFGMFNDVNGTIPGNVSGGTPWQGYFVSNPTQGNTAGVFEKGPNGGGSGQWWSQSGSNPATTVPGSITAATGSYTGSTPAGLYSLSLSYTREASGGLEIDWSMVQAANINGAATSGVYSYTGSVTDMTPASSSWTFDEVGFLLYGSNYTGQIVLDNINVSFVPEPSTFVLLGLGGLGVVFWVGRRRREAHC